MNDNQIITTQEKDSNLIKLCRTLIIMGVAFTPFTTLQVGWMPSPVKALLNYEEYLSMYPLLVFSIIWLVHTVREHRTRECIPLGIFFIVYFIANMAVVIHGNLIFPYYDIADFSKLEGAERMAFQVISTLFPSNPDHINWIISNTLKTCLTTVTRFYSSYFIVFSIFLFYKETSFNIIDDIWLEISAILPVLAIYEIFEIAYLLGAGWGETVLKTINPILYEVEKSHGWWPPLLWAGQIRSVFPEPSYLSYWGALCVPFFLRNIHQQKHFWISAIELAFISFMVLGSNSRTGAALLLGVVCVYFIVSLIAKQKRTLRTILIAFCIIAASLGASVWIMSTDIRSADTESQSIQSGVKSYFDNTLGTLTSATARSNPQRFAMMKAQLGIFAKHPILGVGENLLSPYLADYFVEQDMNSGEIALWVKATEENGFISGGFPPLCEYTSALAEYGLVGSFGNNLAFIIMFCITIFKGFSNRKQEREEIATIIATCAGVIAFGISNYFEISYLYFIVLATMLSYLNSVYDKAPKLISNKLSSYKT